MIGPVLTSIAERIVAPSRARPMVAIGFLGSCTTFSRFSYETLALAPDGAWAAAGTNVMLCVAASLVGVDVGTVVGRVI